MSVSKLIPHRKVANIIITMTTVKMVIAGLEVHSLSQRCAIAGELLDGLSNVPSEYIQSSSTSMVSEAELSYLSPAFLISSFTDAA